MSSFEAKYSEAEKMTRYIYGGLFIIASILHMGALFGMVLGLVLVAEAIVGFSIGKFVADTFFSGKGKGGDNNNNQAPPNS